LVPASTHDEVRLVFLKLEGKNSVIMPLLMPLDGRQLMLHFLGLLIVDADDVVLAGSREGSSALVVIQGHDVVSFLIGVPNLLAGLGSELVEVPVGVSD
jgi:hypothetical protein